MTPTQSDEELKPCPFCGCSASLSNINSGESYQIGCDNYLCPVSPVSYTDDKQDCIKGWNTRHAEQELEAVKREYFEKGKRDLVGALEELSLEQLKSLKSKQAQGGE